MSTGCSVFFGRKIRNIWGFYEMLCKIQTVLHFLISFCVIGGIALCTHGSYLNLCGNCVGGTTDKSDMEGLDRCGICSGQSDCVGCDGIINSPRRRDMCGLCLPPDAEKWNDCRKIEGIYPSVLDLSVISALLPLTIMGAGLAQTDMNTTQCHILPLESQPESPTVREISLEENEIQVKVLLGKSTGTYKVGCSDMEDFAELRVVDSRKLNVIKVNPTEVSVDESVELQVEIGEDQSGNTNGTYWCFVRLRGGETETLRAIRSSDTRFKCSGFTPTTPGIFDVGVVAHEDAAVGDNTTGKTAELLSRANPPTAELAAYSPDLQNIAITFDQNINILDYSRMFSPETEKSLGKGFTCSAVADTLYVSLGDGAEVSESVTISDRNSIRRAGSSEMKLSPNMRAVTVPVSKQNVITPRFSLSLPNVVCADKAEQPVINVKVTKLGKQRLKYVWVVPPLKEWKGRSQRENMLMWKHTRDVEAELNSKSHEGAFLLNKTSLRSGFSYILSLRSSNALGDHRDLRATLKVPEKGNLSITVTAIPSASAIVAEVRVVFCTNKDRPTLRYSWKVNENIVSEDGKLLVIPQMNPGFYNISCILYNRQSNQILGIGSSLTEVVKFPQRVIVFPTNTVVGTMDDITLQALSGEMQWQWSCKTSRGEPCITVGPKACLVEDIVNVTSPMVRVPSGTLPVGSYIWTLNGLKYATAYVMVSANIPPIIKVVPPLLEVDSTKPLSLNADIERLKPGCRIRWKTIRKKGYDYFDLQEDVGLGDMMEIQVEDPMMGEREVPLVIPPARGKWKGLTGGAMYLLRLQTICPEPTPEAHTDVTVLVNAPPSDNDFRILPETGQAVNTKFSIMISEGSDSVADYPLVYRISYQDESNEVQMGVSIMTDFIVILPPGNLTITVKICDIQDSCSVSSKPIMVLEATEITTETIEELSQEIRNDMLSGDTTTAFGKAITVFRSLSQRPNDKKKLDEISSATESAVRDRLRDLEESIRFDPRFIKQSFEFLEQSVTALKFFPDGKHLVNMLTEFKKLITKRSILGRRKRETVLRGAEERIRLIYKISANEILERTKRATMNTNVNKNTIKAIFDLHAKILEQNNTDSNKEEFLKDVRKYMIGSCGAIQDTVHGPILIESSIVTLEVMKLSQNDLKKDLPITGAPNAKIRFNLKSIPRKSCAAIAKYQEVFVGIRKASRVSDVFEVRLIKNGTFKDSFKDDIKSLAITLPLYKINSSEIVDCMTWSKDDNNWEPTCTLKQKADVAVTCVCRDPGIFSAFMTNQTSNDITLSRVHPSTTTITLLNTTVDISIVLTTARAAMINTFPTIATVTTTSNVHTTTSAGTTAVTSNILVKSISEPSNSSLIATAQSTTTVPSKKTIATLKTSTKADEAVLTSIIQDISNTRGNTTLYISGTFTIAEDYRTTIGKNEIVFKESLKKQLAQQLSISDNVIANLIIKPGSILVTVLFIDTEETKAETAIKELVTKLREGSLRLTGQNSTVLRVPPQDLTVKIGTALMRNTGKVRLITYGVVAGTLIAIFLLAVGAAYFKRKRARMPLRLPRLSIDDHPIYRQFHNELSLDGSPATLARYRRDQSFETETIQ